MHIARHVMALFWLASLTTTLDSAQSTNSSDRRYEVSGEVELRKTPSGHSADASEVVIWLVPSASLQKVSTTTTEKAHYRLLQRNKRFEPRMLVVPVGSVVDFPNADPWFHNVFSLYRGKRFDLGLYQAGAQRSVKFDRIGPSYLFCNIHPEMTGVVLVVESDFFGISDKAGHFSIAGVPPGRYTLHVWYENATPEALKNAQRFVTIETQNYTIPTISVPLAKQQPEEHKNKYGQDYDPDPLKTDY